MIKIIFHLVVFGKTPEIALLHFNEIFNVGHADIHHGYLISRTNENEKKIFRNDGPTRGKAGRRTEVSQRGED